ncbi:hypothetical protein CO230_01430 [Chryseobacterium sp. 6424]|uniref:hypothetical protein n=1 Tax=Chryseobacterium sp. 6424 TaxID=2039166 RepID=UPI000EFC0098|nr:hypothetical protein [Chryseobacterium sp. 6424]AYO56908.1 hypothetical protein CO230_01430 [Chryseobacterium sp. 6424]
MKKWITLLGLVTFTGWSLAQSDNRFYTSEKAYNAQMENQMESQDPGGGGPITGDDPVPIDGGVPLLLAAGLGMAIWYARQRSLRNG